MCYDTNEYTDEPQIKSQMKMKRGRQILGYDNVNVAKLKTEPLYVCKFLRPYNGKNSAEPKNDKFVAKLIRST